jgi:hypothetical protein
MEPNVDILRVKKYSDHPGDWYLFVVLAKAKRRTNGSYVTWLLNVTTGNPERPSFYEGHYFDYGSFNEPEKKAVEDYRMRGKPTEMGPRLDIPWSKGGLKKLYKMAQQRQKEASRG